MGLLFRSGSLEPRPRATDQVAIDRPPWAFACLLPRPSSADRRFAIENDLGRRRRPVAGDFGVPITDGPKTRECCKDLRVIDLPGVERLQQDFNECSAAVRVFAVLSPTCPECLVGYELVSQMAPTAIRLVLWTAMLEGDSASVVSTLIGDDGDCTHYWEDDGWPVFDTTTSASWPGSV